MSSHRLCRLQPCCFTPNSHPSRFVLSQNPEPSQSPVAAHPCLSLPDPIPRATISGEIPEQSISQFRYEFCMTHCPGVTAILGIVITQQSTISVTGWGCSRSLQTGQCGCGAARAQLEFVSSAMGNARMNVSRAASPQCTFSLLPE